MTSLSRPVRRILGRSSPDAPPATAPAPSEPVAVTEQPHIAIDIPESDPLFAYLQAAPGPVDLARLELASPALQALRDAGVALVVPLVTQGELIGTLNLGPRLSEQDYSSGRPPAARHARAQAAPAIRVAQLVREQAAEAAERERYEQELKVAQLIQQQFLPRELPELPEWQVAAYYGPARVVGGDFYDFIELGDGRIGVVVGDVTDKGVPAALVMARTHSILRAEAPRLVAPAAVLARANELLVPEMPAQHVRHLPVRRPRARDGAVRVRERGPQPALRAHRRRRHRAAGDRHAARAHAGHRLRGDRGHHRPGRRGAPVLRRPRRGARARPRDVRLPAPAEAMATDDAGSELLDRLLDELRAFTGAGWEQEDDITLVTLRRSAARRGRLVRGPARGRAHPRRRPGARHRLSAAPRFTIEGAIGNEREAMRARGRGRRAARPRAGRLERLKTAVAETVMNAIEYGSAGHPDVPVDVRVDADAQ